MLLNAAKKTIVGRTLNAKLMTPGSISFVINDLNRKSVPYWVNEITLMKTLLSHSNPTATNSTFSTRKAKTICRRIPFPTRVQSIFFLFWLARYASATKTASPRSPRRIANIKRQAIEPES